MLTFGLELKPLGSHFATASLPPNIHKRVATHTAPQSQLHRWTTKDKMEGQGRGEHGSVFAVQIGVYGHIETKILTRESKVQMII